VNFYANLVIIRGQTRKEEQNDLNKFHTDFLTNININPLLKQNGFSGVSATFQGRQLSTNYNASKLSRQERETNNSQVDTIQRKAY